MPSSTQAALAKLVPVCARRPWTWANRRAGRGRRTGGGVGGDGGDGSDGDGGADGGEKGGGGGGFGGGGGLARPRCLDLACAWGGGADEQSPAVPLDPRAR